jgi:3-oxoacyl-[acyl-carrier protein] reductase
MTLTGKTALVTGGSRGIGRAVVRRLSALGARVVYTYRATAPADDPPGVVAVRADQADPGALEAMFAPVRASGLDILVNNAAIAPTALLTDLTGADFDHVMAINARFPLLAMREAATLLHDGGRIINVSTLNTVLPGPGLALYCASKAALEQFTAVTARELGPRRITVNTVSPGQTDTDMLHASAPADAITATSALSALGRIGTPDEVAAVIAWLAGPDATWITGQNIRATGGLLL